MLRNCKNRSDPANDTEGSDWLKFDLEIEMDNCNWEKNSKKLGFSLFEWI